MCPKPLNKSRLLILTLFVGALFLHGCPKPENTSSQKQAKGGKFYGGEYRVNELAELRSLDPVGVNDATSHHIAEQIYDGLLSLDAQLNLIPSLAESWSVSPDGMTYTYRLRKGVYFHDNSCFPGGKGRELKSSDVLYSYTRILDARTKTLGAEYFKSKVKGAQEFFDATVASISSKGEPSVPSVTGFSAPDDYTFVIQLVAPFAPFEFYPALGVAKIHPKEAVEFYKDNFFQHPVGTGAFVFVSWTPDRECKLDRNPRYWKTDELGNTLPFLDRIVFSFIKDDKSQLIEFREGNLDENYRISLEFFNSMVDQNKNLKGEYSKFVLKRTPALSTQFYGMLVTGKELADTRVRQAISYAIDRERIVNLVLKGQAFKGGVHGLVPPGMPGYGGDQIKGYTLDLSKARALLTEAGFPNGQNFPPLTLQVNAGGGRNLQVAEAIQSMLRDNLNIDVKLKQVEFAKHLDEVDAGRVPFFRLGWIADYPDPENFLNLFYGKLVPSDDRPSPINHVRYKNPAFDVLFEKALKTTNREERMAIYRQAEQIAMADAPMLIVFYDEDYRLLQPYVEDYRSNPMDRREYEYVWFNPAKLTPEYQKRK